MVLTVGCMVFPVVVAGGDSVHDSGWPGHVYVQGYPVRSAGLQLPAIGVVRGRPALDVCAAPHAEVQARPPQPRGYGVPCAALDVHIAAAFRRHV